MYLYIGNLLIIQGRIDEAAEFFSRALAVQGDFGPALNGLGQIRANQQNNEVAVAYFRRALRTNPDAPETYFNLGFLEQNRGNLKQASIYYQNAARLQPQGLADYFNQAVDASALGQRARVIGTFETILQRETGCWQARYLLGLELADQGKTEEARAQFLAAAGEYRYCPRASPCSQSCAVAAACPRAV